MSISEQKIELAKMVLEIDDLNLIEKIRALLDTQYQKNWNNLPDKIKTGIEESLTQSKQGKFVSYEDVFKEANLLLKK